MSINRVRTGTCFPPDTLLACSTWGRRGSGRRGPVWGDDPRDGSLPGEALGSVSARTGPTSRWHQRAPSEEAARRGLWQPPAPTAPAQDRSSCRRLPGGAPGSSPTQQRARPGPGFPGQGTTRSHGMCRGTWAAPAQRPGSGPGTTWTRPRQRRQRARAAEGPAALPSPRAGPPRRGGPVPGGGARRQRSPARHLLRAHPRPAPARPGPPRAAAPTGSPRRAPGFRSAARRKGGAGTPRPRRRPARTLLAGAPRRGGPWRGPPSCGCGTGTAAPTSSAGSRRRAAPPAAAPCAAPGCPPPRSACPAPSAAATASPAPSSSGPPPAPSSGRARPGSGTRGQRPPRTARRRPRGSGRPGGEAALRLLPQLARCAPLGARGRAQPRAGNPRPGGSVPSSPCWGKTPLTGLRWFRLPVRRLGPGGWKSGPCGESERCGERGPGRSSAHAALPAPRSLSGDTTGDPIFTLE